MMDQNPIKSRWLELAERCEGAKGRDHEIEAWMGVHLGLITVAGRSAASESVDETGAPIRPLICGFRPCTASLDAIVALIEERLPGREWEVCGYTEGYEAAVEAESEAAWPHRATAATPALALCAAFCRAMAEREKSGG